MSAISDLITQQANDAGVPPSIALAVANRESNTQQWYSNGSLVTGASGEIGVFQLMPATAAKLGVDPTDVTQNVYGGVSYLSQLYNQFGDWGLAVAAYNAGPGNVAKGKIPSSTQRYVASVLQAAGFTTGTSASAGIDLSSLLTGTTSNAEAAPIGALAIGVLGLLVLWWMVD